MMIMRYCFLHIFLVFFVISSASAEFIKCPANRDTWISSQGSEADFNMGKSQKIKLKFIQEFGLIDFDVDSLKGKKIINAWLYVKAAGGQEWGLNDGTDLRYVSLSTVGHEWVEGKSKRYGKDEAGKGATFNESSYKTFDWGWPGAKVYHVTLGHQNSFRTEGELKPYQGWHRTPVDPFLVKALVAKATHGILLMDGVGDVMINSFIYSKDSRGNEPYLMVEVDGEDTEAPGGPSIVAVTPAPNWATAIHGAVLVTVKAPDDVIAYHISINGQPVARWQIPFVKPGETQEFPILDLPANEEIEIEIIAVDGSGNISSPVKGIGKTSDVLQVPKVPDFPFTTEAGDPKTLGPAKIWAFPEITNVDPVTGNVLFEKNWKEFRTKNPVWDGASGTVRLAAARGEIISFQIAVEGPVKGVTFDVSDLNGTGGVISNKGVRVWRNWYIDNQSEYAIPLDGSVSVPMDDNKVENQKLQAVTVDYHIPVDSRPGDYEGRIILKAMDDSLEFPLKVKVYRAVIPEGMSFVPELNCYGMLKPGSKPFIESFRLAHYNRTTINCVHHSHTGKTNIGWIPDTDNQGYVTDWSRYEKNLGGLLDGSLFEDNPRSGIPVPVLYLPFNESWPLDYRSYYEPGTSTISGSRENMTRHHIIAKPLEQAMDKTYQDAFVNSVDQFYKHAEEKGWTSTVFQFYQNNKGSKGGYSLWSLDEPYKVADWMAINFWADLFKKGINDPEVFSHEWHEEYFFNGGVQNMDRKLPVFLYRGDISRPNYQGNFSDGLMTQLYGPGDARMMRDMKIRGPMLLASYGEANDFKSNDWESVAWCLRAYSNYRDGVLPWQSLGPDAALEKGDKAVNGNALILPLTRFDKPVASFRVHALRYGAQMSELLRLLQLKNNWSREHIYLFVNQRVPLGEEERRDDPDVLQAQKFEGLSAQGFIELKEGILLLLED